MKSRFQTGLGISMGKIWLISSEMEKNSTVNQILSMYSNDPSVYISKATIWDVKPERFEGQARFWVYKGSEHSEAQIIDNPETDYLFENEPDNCIQVPEGLRRDFDADLGMALRDMAGIATESSHNIYRSQAKILEQQVVPSLFPEVIRLDFEDDSNMQDHAKTLSYFKNCKDKHLPRYIHVDVGVTGDKFGISCGYVEDFKKVEVTDLDTFDVISEIVPNVKVEWCVGISPTPGQQVPFFKVRRFIKWLTNQGFFIKLITFDSFQSTDFIQTLTNMGYKSEVLSLDRSPIPHLAARDAVNRRTVKLPSSKLLREEMMGLEVSPDGKKIDHPVTGSKDIIDSVAGTVYNCIENAMKDKMYSYRPSVTDVVKESRLTNDEIKALWGDKGLSKLRT
jgi:hypothetical protein